MSVGGYGRVYRNTDRDVDEVNQKKKDGACMEQNEKGVTSSSLLPAIQVSDQDASALVQLQRQISELNQRQANLDQERREIVELFVLRSLGFPSKTTRLLLAQPILCQR